MKPRPARNVERKTAPAPARGAATAGDPPPHPEDAAGAGSTPDAPGAARVKEALLAAAARLLDERGAGALSVRDVARAAGVNHGLVHRHFRSKDALVREAALRASALLARFAPRQGRGRWLVDLLRARPEIARIVARSCLDGARDILAAATPSAEGRDARLGAVRAALDASALPAARLVDARVAGAAALSAALGWFVFRPLLEAAFDLPEGADEELATLASAIDALVEAGPRAARGKAAR